uniref:Uncharacterized protein n=1 Tax=Oryza sativa subsp. japonica TaxID=39947 RepID=Q8S7J6_ORYSJ|nr:Hypothetical protein [Oryza sativa Japonica Group]
MSALVRSVASLYCQGLRRTVRLGGGATAGTPAARAPALDQRRPFLSRVDRMLPAAEFAVVVSCAERPPPAAAAAARRTREDHRAGMAKKEQPLSSPGTQLASPSRAGKIGRRPRRHGAVLAVQVGDASPNPKRGGDGEGRGGDGGGGGGGGGRGGGEGVGGGGGGGAAAGARGAAAGGGAGGARVQGGRRGGSSRPRHHPQG